MHAVFSLHQSTGTQIVRRNSHRPRLYVTFPGSAAFACRAERTLNRILARAPSVAVFLCSVCRTTYVCTQGRRTGPRNRSSRTMSPSPTRPQMAGRPNGRTSTVDWVWSQLVAPGSVTIILCNVVDQRFRHAVVCRAVSARASERHLVDRSTGHSGRLQYRYRVVLSAVSRRRSCRKHDTRNAGGGCIDG